MGYDIQAIISSRQALEVHSVDFDSAFVVPLSSGLALIPITDDLLDEIGTSGGSGKFYKFTPAVGQWLITISITATAAYIEAEYFGGAGGQIATAWAGGKQILAPTQEPEAINIALRLLGISKGVSHDEFDAVGLPRHRHTDDWLNGLAQ